MTRLGVRNGGVLQKQQCREGSLDEQAGVSSLVQGLKDEVRCTFWGDGLCLNIWLLVLLQTTSRVV